MKIKFYCFFCILFLLVLSGCARKTPVIEFEELHPLALSPRVEWLLITDPYVACRSEANYEANVVASFRKGEIFQVIGNSTLKIDDKTESWFAVDFLNEESSETDKKSEGSVTGWIPGRAVKIYSNRLRAEQALKELK